MKITTLGTSGGEGGYPFAEYAIPDGARIAAIRVLGLFLMAVEGVLCIVMAAPLSLLLTGIGGAINDRLLRAAAPKR